MTCICDLYVFILVFPSGLAVSEGKKSMQIVVEKYNQEKAERVVYVP